MRCLGVNVDHVATLREARGARSPDPVDIARRCEAAGARSIVAHLREDRRHIRDDDVFRLRRALRVKFNLEMSVDPDIVRIAMKAAPDAVTVVPERRRERTTEKGLDVFARRRKLGALIGRCRRERIKVSLFVDPDFAQIREARRLGADAVEIHTGEYANAATLAAAKKCARTVERAVAFANTEGLVAHVGHGLDYENIRRIADIQGITEFNIGFAIIARSLVVGIESAVIEMRRRIRPA